MTGGPRGRSSISAEVLEIVGAGSDEEFRAGVRGWLKRELVDFSGGDSWQDRALDRSFRLEWETMICRAGWSGLGWPAEYGGHGLELDRQAIFLEEYAKLDAPLPVNMIGHGIVGPTLLAMATEEQKRRFVPSLLDNSTVWCQGYSEPGTGSDLASLSARAERTSEGYRINGQKIWTSYADVADRCFALARTGEPESRHRGITVFLIDMNEPGVSVSPIKQITGSADYCSVFLDDVAVSEQDRLGDENEGWRIAMAAAGFERGTYFLPRIVRLGQELEDIVRLAAETPRQGAPAIDDPEIRGEIASLLDDTRALRAMADEMLSVAAQNRAPGAEGSVIKLLWSETHQRLLDLAMEILGPAALYGPAEPSAPLHGRIHHQYLWTRAETILAGTSEIMRNIIAERGLGLPR